MAEKTLKGVIIPRHDTAENWAQALNFTPRDGELIVFSADAENKSYNTTVTIDGADYPVQSSSKVRYKFGDGKTNVNVLPFADANTKMDKFGAVTDTSVVMESTTKVANCLTAGGSGDARGHKFYMVEIREYVNSTFNSTHSCSYSTTKGGATVGGFAFNCSEPDKLPKAGDLFEVIGDNSVADIGNKPFEIHTYINRTISNIEDPVDSQDAATKAYVDRIDLSSKMDKFGTVTNPSGGADHSATIAVDGSVFAVSQTNGSTLELTPTGVSVTGAAGVRLRNNNNASHVSVGNLNAIAGGAITDYTTGESIIDGTEASSAIVLASDNIALCGSQNKPARLRNVATPVADNDAVNKAYVDGLFSQLNDILASLVKES